MARRVTIDGELALLLEQFHAAREQRQRATDAEWRRAQERERDVAWSLAVSLASRANGEG